ncbi:MAG: hypothetical protein LBS15_03470 [Endomicrobium sp.]|nr:hypothetical protein [Endomicrobium sp.]
MRIEGGVAPNVAIVGKIQKKVSSILNEEKVNTKNLKNGNMIFIVLDSLYKSIINSFNNYDITSICGLLGEEVIALLFFNSPLMCLPMMDR